MFDSKKFDDMWNALLDYLDGKETTIDGRKGKIKVRRGNAVHPYPHETVSFTHEPYIAHRQPGLACITDLNDPNSWGTLMKVAKRLGFKFSDHGYDW